jgi:hypothetical protein
MRWVFWILGALLIVVAVAGVTFALKPRLYLLTFGGVGVAVLAAYCAVWFRGTRTGSVCISFVAIGLFLSLLDPYVLLTEARELTSFEGSWSYKYYYVDDRDLGYAPQGGIVAESRKYFGDHLDYDVTYSIDANGHRLTAASSDPGAENVLFMGDSFTFGMGLNDDQTLPQLFSKFTDGRYKVINFGVPNYGLHQVVRSLETGRADSLLAKGKVYIVYTAIADHARRAAAAHAWGAQGPVYELGDDGMAIYRGNLHSAFARTIVKTLYRSLFFSHFVLPRVSENAVQNPVPLYIGLVKRARQLAEEKYHAAFIMIFWDDNEPLEPRAKAALDEANIAYIPITAIIPDVLAKSSIYRITPMDGHPTEAANRLIAAYLAKRFGGGTIAQ